MPGLSSIASSRRWVGSWRGRYACDIRLAPGVQLVDVIGSQRLDEGRAQEVRDAEQSIDQRLSRNLGIETDRGLDEEGIQMVIPSFYADDAHVVLLDVVAPGPGPVADVTVRYKDLVHMKNGVARAHLRSVAPGSPPVRSSSTCSQTSSPPRWPPASTLPPML